MSRAITLGELCLLGAIVFGVSLAWAMATGCTSTTPAAKAPTADTTQTTAVREHWYASDAVEHGGVRP